MADKIKRVERSMFFVAGPENTGSDRKPEEGSSAMNGCEIAEESGRWFGDGHGTSTFSPEIQIPMIMQSFSLQFIIGWQKNYAAVSGCELQKSNILMPNKNAGSDFVCFNVLQSPMPSLDSRYRRCGKYLEEYRQPIMSRQYGIESILMSRRLAENASIARPGGGTAGFS